MSPATGVPLALDEMFSPAIAAALRDLGHDVIAVAGRPELRAMTDDAVFAWAAGQGRWLVTENVKDFRPVPAAGTAGRFAHPGPGVRHQPRVFAVKKKPRPLIQALHAWLLAGPPEPPLTEDWLLSLGPAGPGPE